MLAKILAVIIPYTLYQQRLPSTPGRRSSPHCLITCPFSRQELSACHYSYRFKDLDGERRNKVACEQFLSVGDLVLSNTPWSKMLDL